MNAGSVAMATGPRDKDSRTMQNGLTVVLGLGATGLSCARFLACHSSYVVRIGSSADGRVVPVLMRHANAIGCVGVGQLRQPRPTQAHHLTPTFLELCRNLGDDGLTKAAYRGG